MTDERFGPPDPVWPAGLLLSWSGRWHRINPHSTNDRAYCGIFGYTCFSNPSNRYAEGALPIWMDQKRLWNIASGRTKAPFCKRCEKAASRAALS